MDYTITYYSESVQEQILDLPDTLSARYIVLTRRMVAIGPNLGEPHTKAFGDGLFELRLKGAEGIARVFSAPKLENELSSCTVSSKNQIGRLGANWMWPSFD
jgi:phage-related protein